jgi:uncharacterized membrane protein (UPF0127 family)
MEFNLSFKDRHFAIDAEECRTYFSKMMGLMFRKKSKPLLFIFSKMNNQPIHSFFCVPFIAVWLENQKIVDAKYVKPWKISVKSKEKFNKLLEIPSNNRNFSKFQDLLKIQD